MNSFKIENHPILFEPVTRISPPLSWVTHIPFAMVLVDMLNPKSIVELGVHTGNSYFAFCQAVRKLNLATKCHGIDTWQGDPHAGFYSDEVFIDVSTHNERYAAFSTLHRMTFDEAAPAFKHSKIGILHIDGHHTFEAVRHDFQTWLPHIDHQAGVILFHDTQVKENDFGVWKFWQEVSKSYPSYEFKHGSGLGVLAIGEKLPPVFLHFLSQAQESSFIELLFSSRGHELANQWRIEHEMQPIPHTFAQLFIDSGRGFLEEESYSLAVKDKRTSLQWSFPGISPVKLRFDPINDFSTVRIHQLSINNTPICCAQLYVDKLFGKRIDDNTFEFSTSDPQFLLDNENFPEPIHTISIDIEYLKLGAPCAQKSLDDSRIVTLQLKAEIDSVNDLYNKTITETSSLKKELVVLHEESASLRKELASLHENSTVRIKSLESDIASLLFERAYYIPNPAGWKSWKITQPLRRAKHFLKNLNENSFLLKISNSGIRAKNKFKNLFLQTIHIEKTAALRNLEKTGAFNTEFLGKNEINPCPQDTLDKKLHSAIYANETNTILSIHGELNHDNKTLYNFRSALPLDFLKQKLCSKSKIDVSSKETRTSFAILTPFYKHIDYFQKCADSVSEAFNTYKGDVEWIIISDDPNFPISKLSEFIPTSIRSKTHIFSDGYNYGPSARLNEAASLTQKEWLIFLDCDDEIITDALCELEKAIGEHPHCRYISSTTIDVGINGEVYRYRQRTQSPDDLFRDGMTAGHLKAVRRDLFESLGGFDPSIDGCQDYDFALRAAAQEELLYLRQYLYRYRWHNSSQSVANAIRQDQIAARVLQKNALALISPQRQLTQPIFSIDSGNSNGRFCALIRTQGTRLNYLEEAINSLKYQEQPTTAIICIHGDRDAFDAVGELSRKLSVQTHLIHAADLGRKRGYPINTGINYLAALQDPPEFIFILDDDDIIYPNFTGRMHRAFKQTGADVIYAASNKREPWLPAVPGYKPLPIPCLLAANFIPTNSYCMRFNSLQNCNLRFAEDMHYLEDWDFLIQLLGAEMQFAPLKDTLSEFRIVGDGNVDTRKMPATFAVCQEKINFRIQSVLNHLMPENLLFELLRFPITLWPTDSWELEVIEKAKDMIENKLKLT